MSSLFIFQIIINHDNFMFLSFFCLITYYPPPFFFQLFIKFSPIFLIFLLCMYKHLLYVNYNKLLRLINYSNYKSKKKNYIFNYEMYVCNMVVSQAITVHKAHSQRIGIYRLVKILKPTNNELNYLFFLIKN